MQQTGMEIASQANEGLQWEIFALIRQHWLSNLAHNLSNPLFAARGYIRMLLQNSGAGLSEPAKRYLGLALDNIDRLVLLVRGMESFPELSDLEFTSFSVHDLLQEAVEKVRRSPANRTVEVKERFSMESASTIGDYAKLRMALEEFVAAAARFAAPDGVIDISAHEADGRIAVQLTAGPVRPGADLPADLSTASGLWQLHGGRVYSSHSEKGYSLTCELPLIHFPQQPALFPGKGLQ